MKRIIINGWAWYINLSTKVIYKSMEDAANKENGLSIWSEHITKQERDQILDQIRFEV